MNAGGATMGKLAHSGKLLGQIWQFARQNKVYWLVPLVITMLVAGLLVVASQSAAPFIYTLF